MIIIDNIDSDGKHIMTMMRTNKNNSEDRDDDDNNEDYNDKCTHSLSPPPHCPAH